MESIHTHAKDAADRRRRGRESCVLAVGLIGKGEPVDDQGLRCLEKLVGWCGLGIEITFLWHNLLRAEGGAGGELNVG